MSMEPDRREAQKAGVGDRPQACRKTGGPSRLSFNYLVPASCRQPYVKGLTIMVNSIYNGWRFERTSGLDR